MRVIKAERACAVSPVVPVNIYKESIHATLSRTFFGFCASRTCRFGAIFFRETSLVVDINMNNEVYERSPVIV